VTTGFSHFPTQFHLTGMQHDAWLATEKQANFCDFLLTPQNHNLTFPRLERIAPHSRWVELFATRERAAAACSVRNFEIVKALQGPYLLTLGTWQPRTLASERAPQSTDLSTSPNAMDMFEAS